MSADDEGDHVAQGTDMDDAEDTEIDGGTAPVDDVKADDVKADDAPADPDAPADDRPTRPRRGRLLVPLLLAVLLVGSAGFAAWAYLAHFRPDQETNATVAGDALKAANDGSVALLSYAPDTMDKDFANAKSHLTGGFLDYYSQFTHDIVAPAVRTKSVKTSASIVQSAVSELQPGSAVVLLFLNQTTTSKENVAGTATASSVKVGLTKVDGSWLISSFDPV